MGGVNESLVLSAATDFKTAFGQIDKMLSEMRALSSAAKQMKKDISGSTGGKTASPFGSQVNDMKKLAPMMSRYANDLERAVKASNKLKTPKASGVGGGSAEVEKTSASINGMNKSLIKTAMLWGAAIFAAKQLGDAVSTGIKFSAMIESANIAFEVMLGNAGAAKKLMTDLKDLSMYTPIGLEESAKSAKQLVAYGFGINQIVDTMKMLGSVTAATGGSIDDLAYVYGTLRTQGRAYTRDLMQFAMRGIPIYENLASVLGVNVSEIKKLTEEGKVGFKEVEMAFKKMTSSGGTYFGMLERSMETLTGKANLMGKQFTMSMGVLTEGTTDPLKDMADTVTQFLRESDTEFKKIGKDLQSIFADVADVLPGLLTLLRDTVGVLIYLGKSLSDVFTPVIKAITWITSETSKLAKSFDSFAESTNKGFSMNWKDSIKSSDSAERSKGIAAGMTLDPERSPAISQWFIKTFQKDTLNLSQVEEWAKQFKVSTKEVADAALEAGYISEAKFREFTDILSGAVPRFRGAVAESINGFIINAATMANNMVNKTTDRSSYNTDPWEYISDKTADVGLILFDSIEKAVRTVGNGAEKWAAQSAPMAVFDKMGRWLKDGSNKYIEGMMDAMSKVGVQVQAYISSNRTGINTVKSIMRDPSAGKLTKELYSDDSLVKAYDAAIADIRPRWEKSIENGRQDLIYGLGNELERLLAERALLVEDGAGSKKNSFDKWMGITKLVEATTNNPIDDLVLEYRKNIEKIIEEYDKMVSASDVMVDGVTRGEARAAELSLLSNKLADAFTNMNKPVQDAIESLTGIAKDKTPTQGASAQLNAEAAAMSEQINKTYEAGREAWIKGREAAESLLKTEGLTALAIEENLKAYEKVIEDSTSTAMQLEQSKLDAEKALNSWKISEQKKLDEEFAQTQKVFGKKLGEGLLNMVSSEQFGSLIKAATEGAKEAGAAYKNSNPNASSTDVSQVSFKGGAVGGIVSMILAIVTEMLSLAQNFKEFNGIMNFAKTIVGDFGSSVGQMINQSLNGLFNILKALGHVIEPLFAIINTIMQPLTQLINILIMILVPILDIVGAAFAWFYNKVLLPVMNGLTEAYNNFLVVINDIIKWINDTFGTDIDLIDYQEMYKEITLNNEEAAKAAKKLENQFEALSAVLKDKFGGTIDYLKNKMKSLADKQVKTLQDLYEVGAITASQYDEQSRAAMEYVTKLDEENVLIAYKSLETQEEMYNAIQTLELAKNTVDAINAMDIGVEGKLALLKKVMEDPKIQISPAEMRAIMAEATAKANTMSGEVPAAEAAKPTLSKQQIDHNINLINAANAEIKRLQDELAKIPRNIFTAAVVARAEKDIAFLQAAVAAATSALSAAGVAGYASGTTKLMSDQLAMVHKGEAIIPRDFAQGIRNGDMTLTGKTTQSGGGNTIVNVVVNGSVQTERELAASIAVEINRQRRIGALTV